MPDRGSGGRSGRNDRGRQDRARTDRGRADRGRQDRGRGGGGPGYAGRADRRHPERGRTERADSVGGERRDGPAGDRDPRQRGGSRRGAAVPDPVVPDDVDVRELDKEVRQELRSLSAPVAERVGAQLAAAARLIDDDPAAALLHARAARRMGGRLPVVREAVGIAAYLTGEWAEALTELRAARRMSGDAAVLPMIADCERALGRPERALEVSRDPAVAGLPTSIRVEMMIVESGARKDLGQLDAALLALQGPELDATGVEDWTHRLWYAYADALERAGRTEDALRWFGSVRDVDGDDTTDADQRYRDLAGSPPAGS